MSAAGEDISIYHIGEEWWDLCAGPHVETTKDIDPKALEIQRVSGVFCCPILSLSLCYVLSL